MIPAQQLLDQHLDNVAIRLRNPKPFTPNDFPAVQRIEQAIRNKPLEEAWYFDSTGMPLERYQGDATSVSGMFQDQDLYNMGLDSKGREFYRKFSAPVAVKTHNHPGTPGAN